MLIFQTCSVSLPSIVTELLQQRIAATRFSLVLCEPYDQASNSEGFIPIQEMLNQDMMEIVSECYDLFLKSYDSYWILRKRFVSMWWIPFIFWGIEQVCNVMFNQGHKVRTDVKLPFFIVCCTSMIILHFHIVDFPHFSIFIYPLCSVRLSWRVLFRLAQIHLNPRSFWHTWLLHQMRYSLTFWFIY